MNPHRWSTSNRRPRANSQLSSHLDLLGRIVGIILLHRFQLEPGRNSSEPCATGQFRRSLDFSYFNPKVKVLPRKWINFLTPVF
jgi:hypothetical protein